MQKQIYEHVNLKYMARYKRDEHKRNGNGSQIKSFGYLNDFGLGGSDTLLKNPKLSLSMLIGNINIVSSISKYQK